MAESFKSFMTVKVALVIDKNGLDEPGCIKEIQNIGCAVDEILDDEIELEGSETIPVRVFIVSGGLGSMITLKLKYHCRPMMADEPYVWFPMSMDSD